MQTLETERLILRPWRESDLEDLYAYGKDPQIGPNAGWKPHESREESAEILKSFLESEEVRAVVLKENGKAIGSLGLHPDRLHHGHMGAGREIGYVLSSGRWGRGLMTEAVRGAIRPAFETMGLDYLSAAHFPWNERSKRVLQKCGFRYEKYLRSNYEDCRGEKIDEVCYLLTREDYLAQKGRENGGFHAGRLTRDQAAETCEWRYSGGCAAYNSPDWQTALAQKWDIADDEKRSRYFSAILDGNGVFCGYFRLSPEGGAVTLGLGMKPEYCGRGNGRRVMALILDCFRRNYPGRTLELEVRDWNARAVACYLRAGFVETARYRKSTLLGEDGFLRMRYDPAGATPAPSGPAVPYGGK